LTAVDAEMSVRVAGVMLPAKSLEAGFIRRCRLEPIVGR
jgi:hypothetical protein